MSNTFTIKYEVEDGYVGGSRPHYIEIDYYDLLDYRDDPEGLSQYINEVVDEDMRQRVYASTDFDTSDMIQQLNEFAKGEGYDD